MTGRELREIKDRLDDLYSKLNDMKMDMIYISDEILNLKLDILMKLKEEEEEEE